MRLKHSRKPLSDSDRFRFRRGLILCWCFCACTGPSSKEYPFYQGNLIHLFDYFSNFGIAEMAAVHDFFDRVIRTAGEECSTDQDYPQRML